MKGLELGAADYLIKPVGHSLLKETLQRILSKSDRPKTILIVDDEPDARELISTMLARCGAAVQAAESTREALQMLEDWKPKVLIADIGMQGEDGYDLIRKVRSLPEHRGGNIPAVALTAYARIEDRQRALSSGFQIHLTKPVERNQLASAVKNLLGVET